MTERRRSWWGWGWEDQVIGADNLDAIAKGLAARLGDRLEAPAPPPSPDTIDLPDPKVAPPAARAARIQAGALGPVLEEQLRPHGYTLRHFPQSFEFSTLGGWLATRSGGHYATNYTHIDDFAESLRVVTPAGINESRRLPGSGAGPSPDRLFLGSEGALGVITEAWMRVQDRPVFRASASVHFRDFFEGVEAARAISQAALFPANCRVLDNGEAAAAAGVTDGSALLVLGFESADHPVEAWAERALEICRDHGGSAPD